MSSTVPSNIDGLDLRFSSDSEPGITRRPTEGGFEYFDSLGKPVCDPNDLDRIRSLAVPPAYTNVWICADSSGHLQATGRDARGRKQYRYHPLFREHQERTKFHRLIEFGRALPTLRSALQQDLRLHGMPKRKVLAIVVSLLDRTLIRIGNEEYVEENHSFGLTTLRTRHVVVQGERLRFRFMGKSHVRHEIEVHDRRLARLVAKLEELPGQELFRYVDEGGGVRSISSGDVNDYLREISGGPYTAKDFRTWWATVLAFQELARVELPESLRQRKKAIGTAVKAVAQRLGNTPTICRKCYIHPCVIESFSGGSLRLSADLEQAEAAILCLMESQEAEP